MRERLWTRNFSLLGLVNFLMFGSFFLLLPTLPLYVVHELGGSENQVGMITGVFALSAILMRPWSGLLLDQWGRRRVMLLAFALFTLVTAGYLWVSSILLLLLLRIAHGMVFGVASTASGTVAADLVPASRRGEGLGYFGTFTILAMVVGPLIGLQLVEIGSYPLLFGTCLGIAFFSFLLSATIGYPTVHLSEDPSVAGKRMPQSWRSMLEPGAIPYAVSLMGLAVVFGGVVSFLSLYAMERGNPHLAGGYFFVYALSLVIARLFSGRIHDRYGPDRVVYPGMALCAIGLICLGFAEGAILFYGAAALIGAGYGSVQPSVQAIIIQQAPADRRGAATATFFMALDLGIGFGSFFMGWVAEIIGFSGMYLSGIIFVIASTWLYLRARRSEPGDRGGEEQADDQYKAASH